MNRKENFTAGFIRENPVFGLYLGCCSTLAITTSLNNAIGMGVSRYYRLDFIQRDYFHDAQDHSR